MPDETTSFSELLKDKIDDVTPPPPMPPGTYEGVINSHELTTMGKNGTPCAVFKVNLTAPQEDVHPDDFEEFGGMAKLSRWEHRVIVWLTEDSKHRLADLCRSIGVSGKKSLAEGLAASAGERVLVTCRHKEYEGKIQANLNFATGDA